MTEVSYSYSRPVTNSYLPDESSGAKSVYSYSHPFSYLSWINLTLIIIIIIILIILTFLFINRQSLLDTFGISYSVIQGTTTGSSEVAVLVGNQIYVGNSSVPLTLTLNRSSSQEMGRLFGVKNNTGSNITLQAGTIKLDLGQINNTVTVGQTAWLLSTDTTDGWLRLT